MRYLIALAIAGILIGAVSFSANQTAKGLQQRFRHRMIAAQKAGDIPAEVDLDRDDFTDFGTEVSKDEFLQLTILEMLFGLRSVLITVTIAGALLIAYLWPSTRRHNRDMATVPLSKDL